MSLDKLKGAAEAKGGKLLYNRSLGFYEVVAGKKRHKYLSGDILKSMDVPTFVTVYFGGKIAANK